MKPVNHLCYAANLGLSRTLCPTCLSETLHKGGRCVHCERRQPVVVRKAIGWSEADSRNAKMRAARANGARAAK